VFGVKKLAAVVNYSTGQYVDLRRPKYLSRMRYAAWLLCAIAAAVLSVAIFGEGVREGEMWTFAGLVAAILCLLLYSPTNIWRGEDFSVKHPELANCQFYD
jgi:fatty acid desaturase